MQLSLSPEPENRMSRNYKAPGRISIVTSNPKWEIAFGE